MYQYIVGACCRVLGFMLGQFKFHPFFFIFLRQLGGPGRDGGEKQEQFCLMREQNVKLIAHSSKYSFYKFCSIIICHDVHPKSS
jgi:hypothetical protein